MKKWKFYDPFFEYKEVFEDSKTPWAGHIFFAYDLVRNVEPDVLVELGTFKGTSFYSFSQAVKDANLNTKLFAVDTWEGDPQAGLLYGDKSYHFVVDNMRRFYPKVNARLLRKSFVEASKEFKKNSIDILHIDGLHTYEAVKEDYDTWKDKVKENGIIIFHDIKVADFAVWKVWEEAKADNKKGTYIEFEHNHGLGVLFKNECPFFSDSETQIGSVIKYYATQSENFANKLLIDSLMKEKDLLFGQYQDLQKLFNQLEEKSARYEQIVNKRNNSIVRKIAKKLIS